MLHTLLYCTALYRSTSGGNMARIQRFQLDGIRDTGVEIGRGSYAVVKELDFQGRKCAGKEVHRVLYESASPGERANVLRRFEEECELLSQLDHPNIVKFLGVYLGTSSGLPSLVMEYLPDGNLSGYLEKHGVLPSETSLSILRDVTIGLCYLHKHLPPIIHRDLTANNVLLMTSTLAKISAKISDLGVSKILDMSPTCAAQMTQTYCPGTAAYMPPETMVDRPKYTSKIDIFSLGVLIVHVLSGEWPIPSGTFTRDPEDPSRTMPVTEFDRRRSTIGKIEDGHPLLDLIQQCLSNVPDHRPNAEEVIHQVIDAGYYDVILLGHTGMGKSTLGNKLLQVEQFQIQRIPSATSGLLKKAASSLTSGINRFATTDDIPTENVDRMMLSVTDMCELLANETRIRVLDIPGFSNSHTLNVHERNAQLIHLIVRVQAAMNLQVRRVVYFLPVRGILERADGTLQEELQVMYHFFGLDILKCMVVIATNHRQYQQLEYSEEYLEQTKMVFHFALKRATGNDKILCPPVVYIGCHERDTDVIDKLKKAPVLTEEVLKLEFTDNVCSHCNIKIRRQKEEVFGVVDASGCVTRYENSKCHPCFVQKYTTGEKVAGGFAHIATLGIGMAVASLRGSTIWPSFTTTDEECPICKKPPGSPGCTTVMESIKCDWLPDSLNKTLLVNHTNELCLRDV